MNAPSVKVLLIEDNPIEARLVSAMLSGSDANLSDDGNFELSHASGIVDALAILARQPVDVILLDLSLPDSHGLASLARVLRAAAGIPIVVLTGLDDPSLSAKALQAGAQDFLVKGQFDRSLLLRAARYAIERKRAERRIHHLNQVLQAIHDVNRLIARERDPGRLFQQVCDILLHTRGYQRVQIRLIRPGSQHIVIAAHADAGPYQGDDDSAGCDPHLSDLARSVLATGEPGVWSSARASAVGVPIAHASHTFGVLQVCTTLAHALDAQERSLLITLGGDLAVALQSIEDETARKQAEESLHQNAKRFRALIEKSSEAIALIAGDGIILYESPAVTRVWGYDVNELIGRSAFELIHPNDEHDAVSLFAGILQQPGASATALFRYRHKNGSWLWLEVTGTNLLAEPSVGAFVVNFRDVTEQKRAEDALRESEARFRRLAENAQDLIYRYRLDPPGFEYVSPAAETLTGYTPEEHYADPYLGYRLVHPDDRHLLDEVMQGTRPLSEPLTLRWTRKGGSILWTEQRNVPVYDDAGRYVALEGIARDVTVQKNTEALLRKRTEQIGLLYEAAQQLSRTLDPQAVYDTLCSLVAQSMDGDALYVSSYSAEDQIIRCVYARHGDKRLDVSEFPPIPLEPEGAGTQSVVIRTGQALRIPDYQTQVKTARSRYIVDVDSGKVLDGPPDDSGDRPRSALIVPLSVEQNAVGAIQVFSYRPNAFSEDNLKMLEALAGQLAAAAANAHLYQQVRAELAERRRRERELEGLVSFASAMRAAPSHVDIIPTLLNETMELFKAQGAALFTLDPHTGEAVVALGRGEWADMTGLRLPPGSGVTGQVLASRAPYLSNDIRNETRVAWPDRLGGVKAAACAPLLVQDLINGALWIGRTSDITPNEVRLLTGIAEIAANALQRAQLIETLEQRVEERTAQLARERAQLQAILDSAGEGIVLTDRNEQIIYINPAMGRLTGYSMAEASGQTPRLWRSQSADPAAWSGLRAAISNADSWQGELVIRRNTGEDRDVSLTITPLVDTGGQAVGFVGVYHDITHQKELERLKSKFVSDVSHELRTPVTNLGLYLNLLQKGNPEKREQYLRVLDEQTQRLRNLIESILDLSRLERDKEHVAFAPVDLNDIAAQVVVAHQPRAEATGLALTFEPGAGLPSIRGEASQITRVITNLVANAINYTPAGRVQVSTYRCNGKVCLDVQDTGLGIAAEDMPHLFERFYRGRHSPQADIPGSGLGLSIVKEIVDLHGGEIKVASEVGTGTTFTVTLPVESTAHGVNQ